MMCLIQTSVAIRRRDWKVNWVGNSGAAPGKEDHQITLYAENESGKHLSLSLSLSLSLKYFFSFLLYCTENSRDEQAFASL
jgi:hypothetical protein